MDGRRGVSVFPDPTPQTPYPIFSTFLGTGWGFLQPSKREVAMNHRRRGRKLNRNASHRLALFRNLSRALITHESIQTTLPKAKELRPFIEKLITLAKNAAIALEAGTPESKFRALHLRRQ